jgi:hypothetical protein
VYPRRPIESFRTEVTLAGSAVDPLVPPTTFPLSADRCVRSAYRVLLQGPGQPCCKNSSFEVLATEEQVRNPFLCSERSASEKRKRLVTVLSSLGWLSSCHVRSGDDGFQNCVSNSALKPWRPSGILYLLPHEGLVIMWFPMASPQVGSTGVAAPDHQGIRDPLGMLESCLTMRRSDDHLGQQATVKSLLG